MMNTAAELMQCRECKSWHPAKVGQFLPFDLNGDPLADEQTPLRYAECTDCNTVIIDADRVIRTYIGGGH
jgi:hypothetical protein